MDTEYTVFELAWSQTSGPFGSVGAPRLFGWVRALVLPAAAMSEARACILARSDTSETWVEYSRPVAAADASALGAALARLGLPGRAPNVEGVVDTSDGWATLRVSVSFGDGSQAFEIYTESSGFAGPDAEALRSMFRHVFALAGFVDYDWSLYGHRVRPGGPREIET
jgi:hypothetical protein